MELTLTVFLLLLMVGVSGVIVRFLPSLPLPLVQVGMGALAASPAIGLRVSFDPELFMLLFVPPLLFTDGWRVPKREFFRLGGPILMLALGLVVFTVVGAGYFVHWLMPAIPLSAAFALAAVLSPTDAVAVSAVSGRVTIPPRLMHILEGEALLNDASGLVAMKFAVAATLTGTFSLFAATRSFFIVAVGGLAVGFGVAWLLSWVYQRLATSVHHQRPVAHIIVLLLLVPFAVYLLAERLAVSGILAAVAAGMMMNFTDLPRRGHIAVRMLARGVTAMIEFVFNGIIFLLLGLELPRFFGQPLRWTVRTAGPIEAWELVGHAAAIWLALLVLRFVWIWCGVRVGRWARRRSDQYERPSLRLMSAATIAGIRGAVTLAGVLSVPLTLPDGAPFPARDLLIFLASGVILCSLLGGCIGLPRLLRGLQPPRENPRESEEREGRTLAAEAAIRAIEEVQQRWATSKERRQPTNGVDDATHAGISMHLLTHYHQRIAASQGSGNNRQWASRAAALEREMHLAALRAERTELYRLRSTGRINDETLRALVDEIDLVEASLLASESQH